MIIIPAEITPACVKNVLLVAIISLELFILKIKYILPFPAHLIWIQLDGPT